MTESPVCPSQTLIPFGIALSDFLRHSSFGKCRAATARRRSRRPWAWFEFTRSGELLFGFRGHFDFGGADVLDLHRGGAVHVAVVAVEANSAGHLELVLREAAVLEPEFHRAFGVANSRVASTAETEKGLHRFLVQV